MGLLRLAYTEKETEDTFDYCLPSSELQGFNTSILGLGDISQDGEYFEALASIFDLEGFTSFCNQIDPHLVIPEYLNAFLDWLFHMISEEFVKKVEADHALLWCQLPFFAKFMGDGVLFLWDTRGVGHVMIGNIVVSLQNICEAYKTSFLPQIRRSVSKPPKILRCGTARGQVISIGDGMDFVGPCINVASRLQKIGQFSFAFSKRGFNLERCFGEHRQNEYTLIRYPIRGIGEEELLYVRSTEYQSLSETEREQLVP